MFSIKTMYTSIDTTTLDVWFKEILIFYTHFFVSFEIYHELQFINKFWGKRINVIYFMFNMLSGEFDLENGFCMKLILLSLFNNPIVEQCRKT